VPPRRAPWSSVCRDSTDCLRSDEPGRSFADEFSDRLRVIACIEKPNMTHSEDGESPLSRATWQKLGKRVGRRRRTPCFLCGAGCGRAHGDRDGDRARPAGVRRVPDETRKGLPTGRRSSSASCRDRTGCTRTPIRRRSRSKRTRSRPYGHGCRRPWRRAKSFSALGALRGHARLPLAAEPLPLVEKLVAGGVEPMAACTLLGHGVRHTMGDREIDADRVRWAVAEAARETSRPTRFRRSLPLALEEPAGRSRSCSNECSTSSVGEGRESRDRREAKRRDVRRPRRSTAHHGARAADGVGQRPARWVAAWVERRRDERRSP